MLKHLAIAVVGFLIFAGQADAIDFSEIRSEDEKRIRRNAEQGDASSQYVLGLNYQHGFYITQKDYVEAVSWYRKAAEQGLAEAQFSLGLMYQQGQGVLQDYPEAKRWYLLAAEQGNGEAQANLGMMYGKGLGIIQDYVVAHMWSNLSASTGNKDARRNRDILARRMTPDQIAEAQRLAREWMAERQ